MRKKHLPSALERFRIIRPILEDGAALPKIAKHHGCDTSTLKRWVRRYRKQGLAGLGRKDRSDKGGRQRVTPELAQLVEALVLQEPSLTLAAIHRKVTRIIQEKALAPPSYRVVRHIAGRIEPALILLAHEGSKAYEQEYELLFRRQASAPNEIWQADHTPLDIVLIDEKGNPRKPWLTSIIDDYSRAICGYLLSFEYPCAMNTALALRQAIWTKKSPHWQVCGIPAIFYSDNGSDFTSRHIEQVAADLKIRLKNSIPGKPRGRGRIERFFLTVNQLLLMNLPGYAPAGRPQPEAELTLEKFIPLFEQFITDEYHRRHHSGIGMPPIDRWVAGGFLPQLPESLEHLDLLLLTVMRPRKVRRDGIHFQNLAYIEPTLASYVGEDVAIRYDPRDLAEIRVFYKNRFLCRAVCAELAGEVIRLKEIIKARQERKRALRKIIAERKSLMDTLLKSPVDQPRQKPEPRAAPPENTNRKKHTLKLYENE
jgi:putative transposase